MISLCAAEDKIVSETWFETFHCKVTKQKKKKKLMVAFM
jgi:hypothetical protein